VGGRGEGFLETLKQANGMLGFGAAAGGGFCDCVCGPEEGQWGFRSPLTYGNNCEAVMLEWIMIF
jgi:hypothetical protein